MFTQYFGNFLYESNIITRDQFKYCLHELANRRAKLGVLAIEAAYMTPSQVEEIHARQLQVDKKFGELAVEQGYLTEDRLNELLSRQSSPFSVFSQILCDEGYMTYSQLSEQIERYRKQCGMTAEGFARFKNDESRPLIDRLLANMENDGKITLLVSVYIEAFMNHISRFISSDFMFGELESVDSIDGDWISSQLITGPSDMLVSFSGSEEAMLHFSSAFAKKEFGTFDTVAMDILGEFLNCCNGIFTANMIEHGLDLDLEPQKVSNHMSGGISDVIISMSFTIEDHAYRLYMAF